MKKTAVILATLLLAPVMALAEMRIAVIDPIRAISETSEVKERTSALELDMKKKEAEMVKLRDEIMALEEKLKRDAAVMSEADRGKAERELRDGQRDLARRFNELQEDANLRRNEEFAKVQRSLLQEVQTYARANGFDLIVSDGVLFASPAVDVTAQVVAALKAKSPSSGN